MDQQEQPFKPKMGRPPKPKPALEAKPEVPPEASPPVPTKWKMKAKPNWESFDPTVGDTPDRLKIPKDLYPDGMDLLWVTDTALGASMAQHRMSRERKGWTPVHPEDFDGRFDGMFAVKGSSNEINVDGLVLMTRPMWMSERERAADLRRAREQVQIKEQALYGGDLPVTLDPRHPTALKSNKISKSIERIDIPSDRQEG